MSLPAHLFDKQTTKHTRKYLGFNTYCRADVISSKWFQFCMSVPVCVCVQGGAQARSQLSPEGKLSIMMMKVIILGSLSWEPLPLLPSFGSLCKAVLLQSGSCVAWKLLDHSSEEETNRDVIRAWMGTSAHSDEPWVQYTGVQRKKKNF